MHVDAPRPIRDGEELDLERLLPYLREHIPDLGDEVQVSQFPSGHSNLTYFLEDERRGYVLRRPPHGAQVKSGHDMSREHNVLAALHPVFPKAPRPFVLCEDPEILGAPFYVMERVVGVILRRKLPQGLTLSETQMSGTCDALISTLAEIHAVDLEAAGLADFGRPEGYVARQIEGWTRRWGKAKTDEIPEIERAAAWLADNMPPERGATLIHNDFKYDNLVLDPDDLTQVRAVLDWEMATVGDPLMDLGSALGYWVDADDDPILQQLAFGPTHLPGNLDREGVVARYAELSGRDVSDVLFYYVYGLFKIAVIAQQIYYRFKHGHTQDPRFAGLIFAVGALGQSAVAAIESGRLKP